MSPGNFWMVGISVKVCVDSIACDIRSGLVLALLLYECWNLRGKRQKQGSCITRHPNREWEWWSRYSGDSFVACDFGAVDPGPRRACLNRSFSFRHSNCLDLFHQSCGPGQGQMSSQLSLSAMEWVLSFLGWYRPPLDWPCVRPSTLDLN